MKEPKTLEDFKEEAEKLSNYLFDYKDVTGLRVSRIAAYLLEAYTKGVHDQIVGDV